MTEESELWKRIREFGFDVVKGLHMFPTMSQTRTSSFTLPVFPHLSKCLKANF